MTTKIPTDTTTPNTGNPASISLPATKRVSIKFLFKNEVEHSYVMNIPLNEMPKLQAFLIDACKKDWMMIPDAENPGRFCCLKTEEVICFQTTIL